jgi:glycosyltransferase involved in cell wall biosynthesis
MTTCAFTVGIPTFNRGACARKLVTELLPVLPDGACIWISDNASTREVEDYEAIRLLALKYPQKITYTKNETNIGFSGNLCELLKNCTTDWLMFCSDEDKPNPAYIQEVIDLGKDLEIGFCRGGIGSSGNYVGNSMNLPKLRLKAGLKALNGAGYHFNYLSGVVYNIFNINQMGIIDKFIVGVSQHQAYPHLYFDTLTSVNLDVQFTDTIACWEGQPDFGSGQLPTEYLPPYTVGCRLDQFWATRIGVFEALDSISNQLTFDDIVNTYILICEKYMRLCIEVDGAIFSSHGLETAEIARSAASFMKAAIPKSQGYEVYSKCQWAIDKLLAKRLQA